MTTLALGATVTSDAVAFRVKAPAAERVELWLYAAATGGDAVLRQPMTRDDDGLFEATVPAAESIGAGARYYGYRAFGPNWPYDPSWTPGSTAGFVADVDGDGNRFNPNKLLLDPHAREVSHCPQTLAHPDRDPYRSGEANRHVDTGPIAPKGVLFADPGGDLGAKPTHPLKDDIVYEVHVRGLTKSDPDVPEELRGTYAGAALRAPYLRDLGITAVEFLPVHQSQNALNDDPKFSDPPSLQNYWGYQTVGFFAPDRRHASDQSPGGPTREFRAMVKAFHDAGLKVFLDVVYNHTEEAGATEPRDANTIYSFRGLDNDRYYETERRFGDAATFQNNSGVGPNFDTADPLTRDLVLESLTYWAHEMGVDGFRFDLAAVLGNAQTAGGFTFDRDDPANILNRAVRELPVRAADGGAGVDLIAEPYAVNDGGAYQLGNFPVGWAEWNDRFRDTIRASQNKLGFVKVTPGQLATRVAGSHDLFGDRGRAPWASVNYVVCHDGFCLADLHTYNERNNDQPWPNGRSDGGRSSEDEMGWDHGGDRAAQLQAQRTSLALLMLSAGVPLMTGGSELGRTQHGNNNPYNLDTSVNWLDWSLATSNAALLTFTRRLLHLRGAHEALRPAAFFTGAPRSGRAIKDITWLRDDGQEIDADYFEDAGNHFLAWQLDGLEGDPASRLYVAYNGWVSPIAATLPTLPAGESWSLALDTSAKAASFDNAYESGSEPPLSGNISVEGRSVVVAVARAAA
ncbi:Isoamylase [Beijerinckiaceae bacterium RH AL1]|nr:isoamylase [Beijerinckiaceae bacterium]VVB49630.1 Isoamylase [Beijerinckiaceae bacterium RH CH11]VVB49708.1 Isoamylase [Beijerinckiaceae bacterium RH AL8]VVC57000.1 Isoamylase [Beijerinckiaceae bacterium RH AL1]